MATKINTPDTPFSKQTITLNKVSYVLRFKYSARFDRWSVSLYTLKGEAILEGERVIPKQELLKLNNKNDMLGGFLEVVSSTDLPVTRNNFGVGKEHYLVFYPYT